ARRRGAAEPTEKEKPPAGDSGGGGGAPPPTQKAPEKKPALVPATNILLRNTTTKMCADIPGREKGQLNGHVNQATCNETGDNQNWNLEVTLPKGGPGGEPLFLIRNVKDQLCMDLPDFGAQPIRTGISEFTCDGTLADNQLWWIQKQDSGAYWIRNFASNNKCLDVGGYSDGGVGTRLTLFDCSHTDDQEWQVVRPGEG
ncbi:RICIN domain-containing protein, partial [Streptomyces sp. YS-3]|uniref:RICIN domain-containing protein n=1 Tax=Streptomyces sp. YS-3 TaxID=3381352 RepID=UPI003862BB24